MPAPEDFARAAEALAGARFRLHGRDRSTGLDCVGLVGLALADIGVPVQFPAGYRLRNAAITGWCDLAPANGLQQATGPIRRGDVLLTQPGPAQHHLLVALGADRFVHAHAGLGRVVIQPQPYREPPLAQWRLDLEQEHLWQR